VFDVRAQDNDAGIDCKAGCIFGSLRYPVSGKGAYEQERLLFYVKRLSADFPTVAAGFCAYRGRPRPRLTGYADIVHSKLLLSRSSPAWHSRPEGKSLHGDEAQHPSVHPANRSSFLEIIPQQFRRRTLSVRSGSGGEAVRLSYQLEADE